MNIFHKLPLRINQGKRNKIKSKMITAFTGINCHIKVRKNALHKHASGDGCML